jgi:DNA-binding phage protein
LFNGVADDLDLMYYPYRSTGSTRGVIVSPVGEGNPRLSSMVNLVTVLNTELDHALDELGKARAEIAELRAERVERRHHMNRVPKPLRLPRRHVLRALAPLC